VELSQPRHCRCWHSTSRMKSCGAHQGATRADLATKCAIWSAETVRRVVLAPWVPRGVDEMRCDWIQRHATLMVVTVLAARMGWGATL